MLTHAVLQGLPTSRQRCLRESLYTKLYYTSAHISCSAVLWKLMSFTFAMVTLPIGTYFFTVNLVFRGMSRDVVRQSIH
jgi:hypothetical protein